MAEFRNFRRTVGRLNAAQKPLSNDTWCQTQRYSKLTKLFYLFVIQCMAMKLGMRRKLWYFVSLFHFILFISSISKTIEQ